MSEHPSEQRRPLLRVVRGEPDQIEIAALTAVVAGLAARRPAPEPTRRSTWADRAALLRHPQFPAAGAWRASALPR